MKKTVIFDTSAWISFYSKSDVNHFLALRELNRFVKTNYSIILPEPILLEIISVLLRNGFHSKSIRKNLDNLDERYGVKVYHIPLQRITNKMMVLSNFTKLKAMDYQIVCHVLEISPTKFVSFDKKLMSSYNYYANFNSL